MGGREEVDEGVVIFVWWWKEGRTEVVMAVVPALQEREYSVRDGYEARKRLRVWR